jgi:hypothetical protein
MTLAVMTLIAVVVGLTTMGAVTWAYLAESRAQGGPVSERDDHSHTTVSEGV